jgi:hypothetical protein
MTSAGSDGREEPLDENGLVSMESLAREHRGPQRDVMIVLTDPSRRVGTRPISTVAISGKHPHNCSRAMRLLPGT